MNSRKIVIRSLAALGVLSMTWLLWALFSFGLDKGHVVNSSAVEVRNIHGFQLGEGKIYVHKGILGVPRGDWEKEGGIAYVKVKDRQVFLPPFWWLLSEEHKVKIEIPPASPNSPSLWIADQQMAEDALNSKEFDRYYGRFTYHNINGQLSYILKPSLDSTGAIWSRQHCNEIKITDVGSLFLDCR